MKQHSNSSRRRFEEFKASLRDSKSADSGPVHGHHGARHSAPEKPRDRSAFQLITEFLKLLRPHTTAVAFALATLVVSTTLALIPPASTKFVIDNVLAQKPLPDGTPAWVPRDPWWLLVALTSGVMVVTLLKLTAHVSGRWQATRVTKLIQMSMRRKVLDHAIRLPLHRVHELKSGGAASILRQDAGSVGELMFGMIYNPLRAVIQLLGSMAILAWIDWRLLLGALVLVPLVYFTHRTWISRIRPQFRKVRKQREDVDGMATETFGGMRVVRGFNRQRAETNRIMRGNHLIGREELYTWWWMRSVEIVWEVLMPAASALLLLFGGWQVMQGQLTVGDLVMFLVYLMMLLGPLATLAQSASAFQNSLSGFDRVLDLLAEPREMSDATPSATVDVRNFAGGITFDDVSFRYPQADALALDQIDLDVEPGQTIALVGPSGAGKTTLCNLVARFYDPTAGRILLDGIDLRDMDVEEYRQFIGIVEQDVFLFDGTIAENIGYSKRDVSIDEIRQAARIANAAEFIEVLKDGYATVIGERGVKLSGGQRQRLAIARAVLADPKILILDEATSNLDTESERLIQQSLRELMQGRTCFVIAHRLSTITHADRIIVMQHGRILETGTHSELIESNGTYRTMVELQTHPDDVEAVRSVDGRA